MSHVLSLLCLRGFCPSDERRLGFEVLGQSHVSSSSEVFNGCFVPVKMYDIARVLADWMAFYDLSFLNSKKIRMLEPIQYNLLIGLILILIISTLSVIDITINNVGNYLYM